MITADDLDMGRRTERLEAAIAPPMDRAIKEVTADLESKAPGLKQQRSVAVRKLLALGYVAWLQEKADES